MKKIAVICAILGFSAHLVAGDAEQGQKDAAACAACHGADGNTPLAPEYPKLAGQGAKYLAKQLHQFKNGERDNAVMAGQAASLSEEAIANISAFYATLEPQHAAVPDKYIELGQKLYRAGDAATGIPACTACHGPQGTGVDAAAFPALGGQNPQYTIAQLKAFRSGARANDNNRMMRDIASKLSDEQIEALAYYLVGLH
ncbi:c-type cytochrome [Pleionea litopenaei]|uniref:C-type cytochrome n=1 Tax=Pleionea litopenaei TaxID=3070815 RepID=A0AA51RRE8_9GAMM|nr:c-type cytochrome [Pleionea sp. HL-JVS1]WMS86165.1 c-type cytochrome [Pleionea sp. HL-JVS1]